MRLLSKTTVSVLLALSACTALAAQFGTAGQQPQVAPAAQSQTNGAGAATKAPATEALRSQVVPVKTSETKSAEDLASAFVDSALAAGVLSVGQGWNDDEQTYVSVASAKAKINDRNSSDFLKIRAIKALEANLSAKADIIKFCRTKLSVENLMTLPETGLDTAYDKELKSLKEELARRTEAYSEAAREVGAAKGNLQIDAWDLIKAGVDAGLKRYGASLDFSQLSKEKQERLQRAKDELMQLQGQIDALKTKLEKLKGGLGEQNESNVSMVAEMTLMGAFIIGQFESFKDGEYQIATVVSWSPKQETLARAMLTGNPASAGQSSRVGRKSLGQFIVSTDWSTVIGGRKFLDNKGRFYILGVGSWPDSGSGSAETRSAIGQAEAAARASLALMLKGDIEAKEQARSKLQEIKNVGKDGKIEGQAQMSENFASTLSEKLSNQILKGVSRNFNKELKHPLFGQKMRVVVVSMSLGQQQAAQAMLNSQVQSAVEANKANQQALGERDAQKRMVEESTKNQAAYQTGYRDAVSAARTPAQQPAASQTAPAEVPVAPSGAGVPSQGSFQGGAVSKDAFLF